MLKVTLSHDFEDRLHKISKMMNKNESYVMKKAIHTFIENMEDYYLGLKVLKEYEESDDKTTYSMEEIEKELRERHVAR
jgi:predicted DNA-binding protein